MGEATIAGKQPPSPAPDAENPQQVLERFCDGAVERCIARW
jgi:hypothetical protein